MIMLKKNAEGIKHIYSSTLRALNPETALGASSDPNLTEDMHPDEHFEADVALVLRQNILPAAAIRDLFVDGNVVLPEIIEKAETT